MLFNLQIVGTPAVSQPLTVTWAANMSLPDLSCAVWICPASTFAASAAGSSASADDGTSACRKLGAVTVGKSIGTRVPLTLQVAALTMPAGSEAQYVFAVTVAAPATYAVTPPLVSAAMNVAPSNGQATTSRDVVRGVTGVAGDASAYPAFTATWSATLPTAGDVITVFLCTTTGLPSDATCPARLGTLTAGLPTAAGTAYTLTVPSLPSTLVAGSTYYVVVAVAGPAGEVAAFAASAVGFIPTARGAPTPAPSPLPTPEALGFNNGSIYNVTMSRDAVACSPATVVWRAALESPSLTLKVQLCPATVLVGDAAAWSDCVTVAVQQSVPVPTMAAYSSSIMALPPVNTARQWVALVVVADTTSTTSGAMPVNAVSSAFSIAPGACATASVSPAIQDVTITTPVMAGGMAVVRWTAIMPTPATLLSVALCFSLTSPAAAICQQLAAVGTGAAGVRYDYAAVIAAMPTNLDPAATYTIRVAVVPNDGSAPTVYALATPFQTGVIPSPRPAVLTIVRIVPAAPAAGDAVTLTASLTGGTSAAAGAAPAFTLAVCGAHASPVSATMCDGGLALAVPPFMLLASGTYSSTFTLPVDLPAGDYLLQLVAGGASASASALWASAAMSVTAPRVTDAKVTVSYPRTATYVAPGAVVQTGWFTSMGTLAVPVNIGLGCFTSSPLTAAPFIVATGVNTTTYSVALPQDAFAQLATGAYGCPVDDGTLRNLTLAVTVSVVGGASIAISAPLYLVRVPLPRLTVSFTPNVQAAAAVAATAIPLVRVGVPFVYRWELESVAAAALPTVTFLLKNAQPGWAPVVLQRAAKAASGTATFTLPASLTLPTADYAATTTIVASASWGAVAVSATNNLASAAGSLTNTSQRFALVPAAGTVEFVTPAAGARLTDGSPCTVSLVSMAVDGVCRVSVVTVSSGRVLGDVASGALTGGGVVQTFPSIATPSLSLLNSATTASVAVRVVCTSSSGATASFTGPTWAIVAPSSGIKRVALVTADGDALTSVPVGGTTSPVRIAWSTFGFASSATVSLALYALPPADAQAPVPDPVLIQSIADGLTLGTATAGSNVVEGMYRWRPPSSLLLAIRPGVANYVVNLTVAGYAAVSGAAATARFSFVVVVTPAVALAPLDDAFGSIAQGDSASVTVASLGGFAGDVSVVLVNLAATSMWVTLGTARLSPNANATLTVTLPLTTSVAPAVAPYYALRVEPAGDVGIVKSPVFSVAPARVTLTASLPAGGPNVAGIVSLVWQVLQAPTSVATRGSVTIALRNSVDSAFSRTIGVYPIANGALDVPLPSSITVAGGSPARPAFVFSVAVVDFPASATLTPAFTIVDPNAVTFAFTGSFAATPAPVLTDGAPYNVTYAASGFPSSTAVTLALLNDVTQEVRVLVSGTALMQPSGMWASPAATPGRQAPSGFDASHQVSARASFRIVAVRATSLTNTGATVWNVKPLASSSSFTLLPPAAPPVITVTSPTGTSTTVAVGGTVSASWAAVGLPSDASVSVDWLALSSSGTLVHALDAPATAAAAVAAPAKAGNYLLRVSASTTVFATSDVVVVLPPQPRLNVTTPDRTAIGTVLAVTWVAWSVPSNLDAALMNPGTDRGGPYKLGMATGLSPNAGQLSWLVPSTVSTALAVRSQYVVRLCTSDGAVCATSSAFTITAADPPLALTVSTPSGSMDGIMPGSPLVVTWTASGDAAASRMNVSLLHPDLRQVWPLAGWLPRTARNTTVRLPADLPASAALSPQWSVRLTAVDSAGTAPVSSTPFGVAPLPALYRVSAPALGATASAGATLDVTVHMSAEAAADAPSATVNVTLVNRMSSFRALLASGVADGTVTVLVPPGAPTDAASRSSYAIVVSPAGAGSAFPSAAVASDLFTVTSKAAAAIQVTRPSAGAAVTRGDTLEVVWSAVGVTAAMRLKLVNQATGTTLLMTEVAPTATVLTVYSTTWRIPAAVVLPTGTARSAFVVVVSDASDATVYGASAAFSILPPEMKLRVLAPGANAAVAAEQPVVVAWEAVRLPDSAPLVLALANASATGETYPLAVVAANSGGELPSGLTCTNGAVCGVASVSLSAAGLTTEQMACTACVWTLRVSWQEDGSVRSDSPRFPVRAAIVNGVLTGPAPGTTLRVGADVIPVTVSGVAADATLALTLRCRVDGAERIVLTLTTAQLVSAALPRTIVPLEAVRADLATCFLHAAVTPAGASAAVGVLVSTTFGLVTPVVDIHAVTLRTSPPPDIPAALAAVGRPVTMPGAPLTVSWTVSSSISLTLTAQALVVQQRTAQGYVAVPDAVVSNSSVAGTTVVTLDLSAMLPYGDYVVAVRQTYGGLAAPVEALSPLFTIVPPLRSLVVAYPALSDAPFAFTPGALVTIKYNATAVSTSTRLTVSLMERAGQTVIVVEVLNAGIEVSGVVPVLLPLAWRVSPAGRTFFLRLALVDDAAVTADSAEFTINPPAAQLVLTAPAASAVVATLTAGDRVWVNWTAAGFASPDTTTVRVELWQDRYYVVGGDVLLATVTNDAPLADGAYSWVVPGNLPSQLQVYFRIVVNAATEGDAAWGRSPDMNLRSAPLPGMQEWHSAQCAPDELAALPSDLLPLCATTCDACTADGGGVWLSAVTMAVDFKLAAWAGSTTDLGLFKNALGAFSTAGVNLCWPSSRWDAPAAATGIASLQTGGIMADTAAAVASMTRGLVTVSTSVVSVSGASTASASCALTSTVVTTVTGPVPRTDAGANSRSTALAADVTDQVAGAGGVPSADVAVTVLVDSAPADNAARRLRNLQAASSCASSGAGATVGISVASTDDDAAQALADVLADAELTLAGCTPTSSSSTAYPASSMGAIDANAGVTTSGFVAVVPSVNRPLAGVGYAAFASSAFDVGGSYTHQADTSTGRTTSTKTWGSRLRSLATSPVGVIAGVVVAVVVVAIGLAVLYYNKLRGRARPVSSSTTTATTTRAARQKGPAVAGGGVAVQSPMAPTPLAAYAASPLRSPSTRGPLRTPSNRAPSRSPSPHASLRSPSTNGPLRTPSGRTLLTQRTSLAPTAVRGAKPVVRAPEPSEPTVGTLV